MGNASKLKPLPSSVDRVPQSDLTERYLIGRTQLLNRMKALDIQGERQGTKSYLSRCQVERLDELHRCLQTMTMSEALQHLGVGAEPENVSLNQTLNQPVGELVQLPQQLSNGLVPTTLNAFEAALITALSQPQPTDRLQMFEDLERCAKHGWQLSTSQVKEIIGTNPFGDSYDRGSFRFVKAGKIGNQAAWKVEKVG